MGQKRYQRTVKRMQYIRDKGFTMVEMKECAFRRLKKSLC